MSENMSNFSIRIPQSLREWLQKQADDNHRSLNLQILHILSLAKKTAEEKS